MWNHQKREKDNQGKGTECEQGSADPGRSRGRGVAFFSGDFSVHILVHVSSYLTLFYLR